MWTFLEPLNLSRYLIVQRVNTSLVRMPRCLATEISLVLGASIANRLPTREAHAWQKSLALWDNYGGVSVVGKKKTKKIPVDVSWPIEAVFFVYPGKLAYGQGEMILWELKLMGAGADHNVFLEIILPALEEAGFASDTPWRGSTTLWGHYDIQAVYAARGNQWEPVVENGRLDLRYRATPLQWTEGLDFEPGTERSFKRMTWVTPFDLSEMPGQKTERYRRGRSNRPHKNNGIPQNEVPSLRGILEALMLRVSQLLPGKYNTPEDAWEIVGAEEQFNLMYALEQVSHIPVQGHQLTQAPKEWPGRWIGYQTFASIPQTIIPYLQLASILHIGKQTHLGCGTFRIE